MPFSVHWGLERGAFDPVLCPYPNPRPPMTPQPNYITTTRDIVKAAIDLAKWSIICATLFWALAYWSPRAARWIDRDCIERDK